MSVRGGVPVARGRSMRRSQRPSQRSADSRATRETVSQAGSTGEREPGPGEAEKAAQFLEAPKAEEDPGRPTARPGMAGPVRGRPGLPILRGEAESLAAKSQYSAASGGSGGSGGQTGLGQVLRCAACSTDWWHRLQEGSRTAGRMTRVTTWSTTTRTVRMTRIPTTAGNRYS